MPDFHSKEDRQQLVQILKLINPQTSASYGPTLDAWEFLARHAPSVANPGALVVILKMIEPRTAAMYGPLLERWAAKPFDREALAMLLKMINPLTVPAYGPLLDNWAKQKKPPGPLVA